MMDTTNKCDPGGSQVDAVRDLYRKFVKARHVFTRETKWSCTYIVLVDTDKKEHWKIAQIHYRTFVDTITAAIPGFDGDRTCTVALRCDGFPSVFVEALPERDSRDINVNRYEFLSLLMFFAMLIALDVEVKTVDHAVALFEFAAFLLAEDFAEMEAKS